MTLTITPTIFGIKKGDPITMKIDGTTSFGEMLFATMVECGNDARKLDATLTERVREWADNELKELATVEIEPVTPWGND